MVRSHGRRSGLSEVDRFKADEVTTTVGATEDQPVVDVTAYGAVGDGGTDDTAAIDSAVSTAESLGGILYFPATGAASGSSITDRDTEYVADFTNRGVSITSDNVTVAGGGMESVALIADAAETNAEAVVFDNCEDVAIEEITLDSRISTKTGFGTLTFRGCSNWRAERVACLNNGQLALQLGVGGGTSEPSTGGEAVDCFFGRCANDGFVGSVGILDGSDDNEFRNCEITGRTPNGISHSAIGVETGSDNDFINIHAHDIDGPGFRQEGDTGANENNRVKGGRWHNLDGPVVKDAATSSNVDNCFFGGGAYAYDIGGFGVELQGTNWTIGDVIIDGAHPDGGISDAGITTASSATGLTVDGATVIRAGARGIRIQATGHEIKNALVVESQRTGIVAEAAGRMVHCDAVDNGQDTGAADFNRAGFKVDGPSGDYDATGNTETGAPAGNGLVLSGTHGGTTRVTLNDLPDGINNAGKAAVEQNNVTS